MERVSKEQLKTVEELIEKADLRCKLNPKTGELTCRIPEDLFKAIANLEQQPRRITFELLPKVEMEPSEPTGPEEGK